MGEDVGKHDYVITLGEAEIIDLDFSDFTVTFAGT